MPKLGRLALVQASLIIFIVLLVIRAAQLQIIENESWSSRAQRQQVSLSEIPAPRGAIFDITRLPLAESRELFQLGISPREVRDRTALRKALARLHVSESTIRQATRPGKAWVLLPGRYSPGDVAELRTMRGVYATPVYERRYSPRSTTRRLVGRVDLENAGSDGLERTLDQYLRGTPGRRGVVVNAAGSKRASPEMEDVRPRAGNDVTLTISEEWQEIAERALEAAVDSTGASGGDIVVLDPNTGAIRALSAVRRNQPLSGLPALTEPYEPGSTIKPFIAATLLQRGKVNLRDRVDVSTGSYTVNGRTISDTHIADSTLDLAGVISNSSNVGIVKFAERLTPREQYTGMRDFGFGTPTSIPYPSESPGSLPEVEDWSSQSNASLAIGYEVAVTPLQLALAYAAIANGGELLEPGLIEEIRSPDGTVLYRHERRVVRRVVSEKVAGTVREMLRSTVTSGTGREAALAMYEVGGKTGTAKRAAQGGGYERGSYNASFVGLFPADDPQLVILVKLEQPDRSYYGGQTAAPAFRATMQAALAARDAVLDRRSLATARSSDADTAPARETVAVLADSAATFDLPLSTTIAADSAAPATVPNVVGLSLREAVKVLHGAGFRARIQGTGSVRATMPPAGVASRRSTLVRVVAER